MEEKMALEMRGLGQEGLTASTPDSRLAKYSTMLNNKEAAPAVEAVGNKTAAAAGSALVKAASWSDFVIKPAANKASSASIIEPAAKAEGKTKQAAATGFERAARAEGKNKPAAASSIEPAAKAEGKPAARVKGKPQPTVIAVGTETVREGFIEYLRTRPLRRPPLPVPKFLRNTRLAEHSLINIALNNEIFDLYEDILRQHEKKGYAVVRVERLDNGMKRWYRLPEVETA